jgi:uncharacterized RDD family membrane protein YckC
MQYEERARIATPEGVELELVLAGLASRFIAELIDSVLLLLLLGTLIALAVLAGGAGGFVLVSIAVGGALLISVAYNVAFEVLAAGRTPGKRWNGLRVVMASGGPVGLRASAVRNLVRLLEGLPLWYAPAIVSILVTRRNQRLGDLAADTLVVREPLARPRRRRRRRRRSEPAPRKHPLSPTLQLDRWDVSAVTQEDLAAIRTFLARRDGFTPAARDGLARELAARLEAKLAGHPPGLSPEALLEGVAAAKASR